MANNYNNNDARNILLSVSMMAIIANAFSSGGYDPWDSMVGIILAVILYEFWSHDFFPKSFNYVYEFTASYVVLMVLGVFMDGSFFSNPDAKGEYYSFLRQLSETNCKGQYELCRGGIFFALWFLGGGVISLRRRTS